MEVQKLMVKKFSLLAYDVESYHWASNQHLKELWCLHHMPEDIIWNLKVGTQTITQHHIPNDLNLQQHHYKKPSHKNWHNTAGTYTLEIVSHRISTRNWFCWNFFQVLTRALAPVRMLVYMMFCFHLVFVEHLHMTEPNYIAVQTERSM